MTTAEQLNACFSAIDELERENERLLAALTQMAEMPEYDQDDAQRLRNLARLALVPSAQRPSSAIAQPCDNRTISGVKGYSLERVVGRLCILSDNL